MPVPSQKFEVVCQRNTARTDEEDCASMYMKNIHCHSIISMIVPGEIKVYLVCNVSLGELGSLVESTTYIVHKQAGDLQNPLAK